MNAMTLSQHVHQIAEALPSAATWDDVRYQSSCMLRSSAAWLMCKPVA